MMNRWQTQIVSCIIVLALWPEGLMACPGCNSILGNLVGRGFNLSVLFLMAMPFLVAGSIALGIVFMARKPRNSDQSLLPNKQANQTEEKEN